MIKFLTMNQCLNLQTSIFILIRVLWKTKKYSVGTYDKYITCTKLDATIILIYMKLILLVLAIDTIAFKWECIWSILLIKSDLKWCIHLSTLFLFIRFLKNNIIHVQHKTANLEVKNKVCVIPWNKSITHIMVNDVAMGIFFTTWISVFAFERRWLQYIITLCSISKYGLWMIIPWIRW